jgi:hypothetical protein
MPGPVHRGPQVPGAVSGIAVPLTRRTAGGGLISQELDPFSTPVSSITFATETALR